MNETTSTLIPDGNYKGRAVEAWHGVSSGKGTNFVQIMCEITDGKYAGRQVAHIGWMNDEKNTDRTMKSLILAGWDCVDPLKLGPENGVGSTVFDMTIEVEAGQPKLNEDGSPVVDEYGQPVHYPSRNRVAWINDPNTTAIGRKLEPAEAAALGDNLRKLLAVKGYKPLAAQKPAGHSAGYTNGNRPPPSAPPAETTAGGRRLPV